MDTFMTLVAVVLAMFILASLLDLAAYAALHERHRRIRGTYEGWQQSHEQRAAWRFFGAVTLWAQLRYHGKY